MFINEKDLLSLIKMVKGEKPDEKLLSWELDNMMDTANSIIREKNRRAQQIAENRIKIITILRNTLISNQGVPMTLNDLRDRLVSYDNDYTDISTQTINNLLSDLAFYGFVTKYLPYGAGTEAIPLKFDDNVKIVETKVTRYNGYSRKRKLTAYKAV